MTEADISRQFIDRVYDVNPRPIDHVAYETSQEGIMRLIYRTRYYMGRAKTLTERMKLKSVVSRLMAIEKDIQKALERH